MIPYPQKNDSILAWARSITGAVNAIGTFSPDKMVQQGLGSFALLDLPKNRRDRSAPSAALPTWRQGRFAIAAINLDPDPPSEDDPEGEDESELVLKNCFVRVGGKTYSMGTTLTGFKNAIVAIRIELNSSEPALEYQSYATVGDLKAAEANRAYYIIPLFQFDADGGVVLDWRLGPDAAMGEF